MAENNRNNTKEKDKEEKEVFYPTNDYCFKRLFGYKGNEAITQGLLEAILGKKCEVVEVKSDEVTEKDLSSDKVGVLDVFVKEQDGTQINLEMQMVSYDSILKRVLFYWSKKYLENIKSGEDYSELKPTKVILIANFEIEKLKSIKEIASSFKILDQKTGKIILTNDFEIVIIEMRKIDLYKSENQELINWLEFIKNPNELGGDILANNETIKKAKEEYDKIMADEHERSMIKLREKYMLDYNTLKKESYEHGKEDGIGLGFQQGKQEGEAIGEQRGKKLGEAIGTTKTKTGIAKKLLSMGLDIEKVQEATGLTKDEIEALGKK
jgi:predicted transposase/invertase (TIGR01784 family)